MDGSELKLNIIKKTVGLITGTGGALQSGFRSVALKSGDPFLNLASTLTGFAGGKLGRGIDYVSDYLTRKSSDDSDDTSLPTGNFPSIPSGNDSPLDADDSISRNIQKIAENSELVLQKVNPTPEIDKNIDKLVRISENQQIIAEDALANQLEDKAEAGDLVLDGKNIPSPMKNTPQSKKGGIFDSLLGAITGSGSLISALAGWDIIKFIFKKSIGLVGAALSTIFGPAAKLIKNIPVGRLLSKLALPATLLNLVYDGFQGIFKAKEWNVNSVVGAIGNIIGGGFNNKLINMFAQAGSWGILGATAGSVIPGIGTIVGGILGTAFGAIAGYFGGERIAKELQNVVDLVSDSATGIWEDMSDSIIGLWTSLRDMFVKAVSNMKIFMYDAALSVFDNDYAKYVPGVESFVGVLKEGKSAAEKDYANAVGQAQQNSEKVSNRFKETANRQSQRSAARSARRSANIGNSSQFNSSSTAGLSRELRENTTRGVIRSTKGKLSADAARKTIQISKRLKIDPEWLVTAMSFETGGTFNPATKNPNSSATGLIQFMRSTAAQLGTTTEELAQMTQSQQLDYVEKYLRPYAGRMNSFDDVYAAILAPSKVGESSDSTMYSASANPQAYFKNSGLDLNKDYVITKGEAASKARQHSNIAKKMLADLDADFSSESNRNLLSSAPMSAPVVVVNNTGGNVIQSSSTSAPMQTSAPYSISTHSKGGSVDFAKNK